MNLGIVASMAVGASLLTLAACGEKIKPISKTESVSKKIAVRENDNSHAPPVHVDEADSFHAVLRTLNGHIMNNKTAGDANLEIRDGKLIVEIEVEGAPANIMHIQHIHSAFSCPTMEADVNNDGFVDVIEGLPSYGPILLNLDGDLTDHQAGAEGFPVADVFGNFFYSQSADLEAVIEDLKGSFRDESPALARLQGSLNLAGRHIVVHGVPANTNLPDSVQSIGEVPSHVTLPIACGEIRKAVGPTGSKN